MPKGFAPDQSDGVRKEGIRMKFDHVAVNVTDIPRSIAWYKETLGAKVLYSDDSWAFLEVGGGRIALTLKQQHPAHIAFDVGSDPPKEFLAGAKRHRDGTISRYETDPDGNAVEYIHYPPSAHPGIIPHRSK